MNYKDINDANDRRRFNLFTKADEKKNVEQAIDAISMNINISDYKFNQKDGHLYCKFKYDISCKRYY